MGRIVLTIDGQMKPSAIFSWIRCPVRKDDATLVPALIALSDVGEIDAALTVSAR